jgi:hypothetical protein
MQLHSIRSVLAFLGVVAALSFAAATQAQAVVLVDLSINATGRPYNPANPVTSQEQRFTVPGGPGILIMTYVEEQYVGGPGGFTLENATLSPEHIGWGGATEYVPRSPIAGQRYQVRTTWTRDFSRMTWVATLTARHEYQAFQVRNAGRQLASRQRLVIEFIPGATVAPPAPAPPAVAPPPAPLAGLPAGADSFDSTSILRGDPFNGGDWANSRNGSATAIRTLGQTVCISGLSLQSGGSDMSTRGSTIRITLSGPNGAFVALDLRDAAVNRGFSPGGSGNVLPAQSVSFPPVATTRVEVAMTGNGWFLLSGLRFQVAPCP